MAKVEILEINKDKNCSCGGLLATNEHYPFASGIFYKCANCVAEYHKIKIIDMTGKIYFQLIKIKGI